MGGRLPLIPQGQSKNFQKHFSGQFWPHIGKDPRGIVGLFLCPRGSRPAPTQLCHLPAPLARGRAASWSDDTDVSQAPRCVGTREISPTAGKARFTWSLKVYVDREMGMLGPLLSVTRLRSRCQPGCDHLGSGAALSQAPLGCCQESAPCGCRTEVPGSGWLPAPSPCHHYLHSPPRASHSEAAFFFQASKRNSAAAVDFFFFT